MSEEISKKKRKKTKLDLGNALGGVEVPKKKKKKSKTNGETPEATAVPSKKKKKGLKTTVPSKKKKKIGKKNLAELKSKVKTERKKPKTRELEFLDLEIEKGIPVPPKGRPSLKRLPFDKLTKKDTSFLVPFDEMVASQVNSAVGQENIRAEGVKKFIFRSVEEGIRVFRTE